MENLTIFDTIDEDLARTVSRRRALSEGGSKLAMGAMMLSAPLALAAMARSAFAQGIPQQITDVLNFALTLEYLEAEFYVTGLNASGLIPADKTDVFDQIRKHEVAHVAFLQSVLGAAAVSKPQFDFTAGNGSGNGPFAGVFTDYNIFAAVAQAFEDTGVRAYKGQAVNLMSNDAILTAALQIHSVEARHAAMVRRCRGNKAWITRAITDIPGTQAVYAGEANVVQNGIRVTSVTRVGKNGGATSTVDAVTEAFDEPLSKERVLAIVDPFIVG